MNRRLVLSTLAAAAVAPLRSQSREIVLRFQFNEGANGWLPGFADYSLQNGDLQRQAEIRPLPATVDPSQHGYYLSAINRSDDLFMFLKRELTTADGVEPNRLYSVSIDVEFASEAATGCFGVGGAPGEAVAMKSGVTIDEPVTTLTGQEIRLNIDKGNQATGGLNAGPSGNIANGRPCEEPAQYVLMNRLYHHPVLVRTDNRGTLWVLAGTDSGYEGRTSIYYFQIIVTLRPL